VAIVVRPKLLETLTLCVSNASESRTPLASCGSSLTFPPLFLLSGPLVPFVLI
jgi:hypothetical protein